MTALQTAEAKLRDIAGYRGQASAPFALTSEDCRAIADELDRLRGGRNSKEIAHGVLYQAVKDEALRQAANALLDALAGQSVEAQYEALATLSICTCSPACPHPEQLGSQHDATCPRYRLVDPTGTGNPMPEGETP